MFVCEQNIIVKVSIVVTCVARDLILPRFQIICWNLWKAFGSIIPAVGLHSQYCWMLRYAPPQPKPERPILFAAWGRAAQAWWSNVGWWGMFSKEKNVVKPNSLDDNSKMIFFLLANYFMFCENHMQTSDLRNMFEERPHFGLPVCWLPTDKLSRSENSRRMDSWNVSLN